MKIADYQVYIYIYTLLLREFIRLFISPCSNRYNIHFGAISKFGKIYFTG